MNSNAFNIRRDWFVLSSLVGKDFKLKYRRSVLGILWSVLNPLLMMVVLSVVFSFFFRFQIEYYPVYLILGQTLFTFMTDATSNAMGSIVDSASLIKKIRINKAIFPIEKVTFCLDNFLFSLVAVIGVMVFFQIQPNFNMLLLPVLLISIYLFSLGLGLLLSSLAVFFRDMFHLWSVFTMAWMYLTPVFYPVEILPDWVFSAMQFNPMYYYIGFFRDIFLNGTTPDAVCFLACFGMAIVALAIGYLVFSKTQRKFILYV